MLCENHSRALKEQQCVVLYGLRFGRGGGGDGLCV